MKIRNGFVSNSSSSSFILITKEDNIPKAPKSGAERWINVDFDEEVSYCRGDIMKLSTVEEKIKYVIALYALWYANYNKISAEEYADKMTACGNKIHKLCKKYGYQGRVSYPPVHVRLITEEYDSETDSYVKLKEPRYEISVDISTECTYENQIVELIEDKDTSKLEKFLFHPHSFSILGGDEYKETYDLGFFARQEWNKLKYDYDFISDNEEKDEWGTRIPDYWDNNHIPKFNDDDDKRWEKEKHNYPDYWPFDSEFREPYDIILNLPFKKDEDCDYKHCDKCTNDKCGLNNSLWCHMNFCYQFRIADKCKECDQYKYCKDNKGFIEV